MHKKGLNALASVLKAARASGEIPLFDSMFPVLHRVDETELRVENIRTLLKARPALSLSEARKIVLEVMEKDSPRVVLSVKMLKRLGVEFIDLE